MDVDDQFEDFTTASDWEQFTARLEQLLSEWLGKPVESENVTNNWVVMQEKVTFSDFPFNFSYYRRVTTTEDSDGNSIIIESSVEPTNTSPSYPPYILRMLSSEPDFPPRNTPCPVSEFFSLEEFAVLTSTAAEPVHKESRLKLLLSSACIALNNTTCNFPIFVQYHGWNQNYYYGVAESGGVRSAFQMIRLKSVMIPTYLSGLIDVFKSKIGQSLSAPIIITAHFFYNMSAWHEDFTYDSFPPELFDVLKIEHTDDSSASIPSETDKEPPPRVSINQWSQFYSHTSITPFGSMDDPFSSLELVCGWPTLTDDIVVDSATYTDLEPENAPEWHFSLKLDANADFRLRDVIEGVWNLSSEHVSIKDILGKSIEDNEDTAQYTSALDRLTSDPVSQLPVPGINTVIGSAHRRLLYSPSQYTDLPPISTENIDAALRFLFPDAEPNPSLPYQSSFDRLPDFKKDATIAFWENLQGVKSSPIGSLVWRLATLIGNLHAYNGGNMAVAHMWTEFVLELRYRWEKSALICGLERGAPNSNSCLLNQKLQMLNCCIEKKIARAEKENEKNVSEDAELAEPEQESEDDDEFFDCDDTINSNANETPITKFMKPTGRLRKCGRLRLLNSGEPMYIPITQDPAPLTEDVVEEQAKILVELGNDAEGSEMRAKMMSASLLSDMESFKAANPGALLEDFVRWYSPRDWIESDDDTDKFGNKMGELSARMKVPGNLWIEVWSTAHPVPVRRQKRLFDDTREAEKVLHWLGNQTLSDICHLLFPCVVHAATLKVVEEAEKLSLDYQLPVNLPQQVSQLSRCFGHICGSASETNVAKNLVLSSLSRCEAEITQIRSFQHKFPSIDLTKILKSKQENKETYGMDFLPKHIKIDGGYRSDVGKTIKEIFVKEQSVSHLLESDNEFKFGKPAKRVFVLKYIPPKSIANESVGYLCLPQRMSCLVKEDLFVSAGTFSLRTDLG